MKLHYLLFLFTICMIFFSCTKVLDDVTFHGRVVLKCDQTPIANAKIYIYREFDTGTEDARFIAATITDDDGNYSITGDVEQKGSFSGYSYQVSFKSNIYGYNTGFVTNYQDNSKDVEQKIEVYSGRFFGFHIRNSSPQNNSDLFKSFVITTQPSHPDTICKNLYGQNVDTTIYKLCDLLSDEIKYKFSFVKNGIQTTDSALSSGGACKDTLTININY